MKEAKQKKLNNKIHVIPSERSKQFIENFNKNKPTEEFIESCKKAGELFGGENDKSTDQNVADVPIDDLVSRAEVLALINTAMFSIDNRGMQDYIFNGLRREVHNLPSADRPTLKQTDTMIIADALRYLVQDTERHEIDRTRAEELREQILQYGASMWHSADRPKGEWLDEHGDKVEFDEENGSPLHSCWCSVCGEWLVASDEYPTKGNFCPNCGADMQLNK